MRGHTTYAWWPAWTSSRTRVHARSIHPGFHSGATADWMGFRPPGSSSNVETAKSPKTVIAMVRGIGVAVITSTCGTTFPRALPRSWSRCSTPKRCCSSTTTIARSKNSTESWMSACVPMTMSASPVTTSRSACFFSATFIEPVKSTTLTPSGTCPAIDVACCAASTSVGASSAACFPASTAWSIAKSATSVLPEPTSPCRSRDIGVAESKSCAISPATLRWPAVSSNGRLSRRAARAASSRTGSGHASRSRASRRRSAMTSPTPKASLYFSRQMARSGPDGPGMCTSRMALSRLTIMRKSSGSGIGGRLASTAWMAAMITHDVRPAVAG